MDFRETDEQIALRSAVKDLATKFGRGYIEPLARAREFPKELWAEAGRAGFLGVNLPEEFGGGGAGMFELSLVYEELSANGTGLLMMVVSPAIVGTIIARFGTDEQKKFWLPGMAEGSKIAAFGITEPDAGSNSHKIITTARKDGSDWLLTGRKVFISGVDAADAVLIVSRTEDSRTGNLKPVLFMVPTDTPGFQYNEIPMDVVIPERQYELVFDDIRLPADALIGEEDAAIAQLFAGLNPERIMAGAGAVGLGRYALTKGAAYANERSVWKDKPIGTHQAIAHPLAKAKIEIELAKLMVQKAASLYDLGDDMGAGEAANMGKYAAAEAAVAAVEAAIHTHGGNGLASEYGLGNLVLATRIMRVAPVSREMILNFIAQFSLGLPKSY